MTLVEATILLVNLASALEITGRHLNWSVHACRQAFGIRRLFFTFFFFSSFWGEKSCCQEIWVIVISSFILLQATGTSAKENDRYKQFFFFFCDTRKVFQLYVHIHIRDSHSTLRPEHKVCHCCTTTTWYIQVRQPPKPRHTHCISPRFVLTRTIRILTLSDNYTRNHNCGLGLERVPTVINSKQLGSSTLNSSSLIGNILLAKVLLIINIITICCDTDNRRYHQDIQTDTTSVLHPSTVTHTPNEHARIGSQVSCRDKFECWMHSTTNIQLSSTVLLSISPAVSACCVVGTPKNSTSETQYRGTRDPSKLS